MLIELKEIEQNSIPSIDISGIVGLANMNTHRGGIELIDSLLTTEKYSIGITHLMLLEILGEIDSEYRGLKEVTLDPTEILSKSILVGKLEMLKRIQSILIK